MQYYIFVCLRESELEKDVAMRQKGGDFRNELTTSMTLLLARESSGINSFTEDDEDRSVSPKVGRRMSTDDNCENSQNSDIVIKARSSVVSSKNSISENFDFDYSAETRDREIYSKYVKSRASVPVTVRVIIIFCCCDCFEILLMQLNKKDW